MGAKASIAVLLLLVPASEAFAQRGSQHLNSPGYQRALMESRKKVEPTLPATPPRQTRHRRKPGS